jgi:hypothetical protein
MRRVLALSIVGLIAAGGCRMCASPYDYCGPVVECDDSVHPAGYTMPTSKSAPETVPAREATPQLQPPSPVPGPQSETPQASRTRSSMRQARRRPAYPRNDQNSDTVVPQSRQIYER